MSAATLSSGYPELASRTWEQLRAVMPPVHFTLIEWLLEFETSDLRRRITALEAELDAMAQRVVMPSAGVDHEFEQLREVSDALGRIVQPKRHNKPTHSQVSEATVCQVRGAIESLGGAAQFSAIAASVDKCPRTVREALAKLITRGDVVRTGSGGLGSPFVFILAACLDTWDGAISRPQRKRRQVSDQALRAAFGSSVQDTTSEADAGKAEHERREDAGRRSDSTLDSADDNPARDATENLEAQSQKNAPADASTAAEEYETSEDRTGEAAAGCVSGDGKSPERPYVDDAIVVMPAARPTNNGTLIRRPVIVQPWRATYSPADLELALEMFAGFDSMGVAEAKCVADACHMTESQSRSVRVNYLGEIRSIRAATSPEDRRRILDELRALFDERLKVARAESRPTKTDEMD